MEVSPTAAGQVEVCCRKLLEKLPNAGVYIYDRNFRVTFATGKVVAQPPFPSEALIGKSLSEITAPEVYADAECYMHAAFDGSESNYEVHYPTGETIEAHVLPLPDATGYVGQVMVIAFNVTERNRAEAARQARERKLESAMEASNLGLWDWDLRTNQVHYSAEWKHQLGYADEEIGNHLSEWESRIHPDDLPQVKQLVLDYVGGRLPKYQYEFRLRHKDGSYRNILTQGTIYHDDEGRPAQFFGSHIDITQSRAMENALRDSEARYRSLFENNHSIMLVVDPEDGAIVDANPAAANYYGWSREQLRCMNIRAINTASAEEIQAGMRLAREDQQHHFWFKHRRADGAAHDVEIFCGPVQVGDRILLYSIVHDISERRRAEQALLQSEAALKRSQAVAHVGHWTWDARTNTVTWSDEMKRIFGLDPETFEGDLTTVIEHAMHPDDAERLRALNGEVGGEQRPAETEYRVVWPYGSVHYVYAIPGDRTLDEQGNVMQLSGVVQDITERKRAQMLQEQLQRQERLAAVGQLAAGIAHDFNNIMSVILIYAELLSQAPGLTEKQLGQTVTIMDQTLRATRMIRQILDFSRRSVLKRQSLDLLPLLKEQEKLLKQTLPENIQIKLAHEQREYFVFADPTRMQQLVMNLVINARDAMPEGGTLQMKLAQVEVGTGDHNEPPSIKPGLWVRLSVSDTGTGIAPEHIARIFEPFFTTKEPGSGTGLGLAQAHGIVAQHDGHIFVASERGVGTTFTIYLPALTVKGETVAIDAAHQPVAYGHGEHILVVEDYAEARTSLVELLETWHYHVVEAANGIIALTYLTQPNVHVDLILSDVIMPQMGGFALVKALRQCGIWTPVILMSGHTKGEDQMGLRDMGVHAWLDKPIGSWQLAKALTNALAHARAQPN